MMRREATTTGNTHDGKTHIDDGDDRDIKVRQQTQKATHELATQKLKEQTHALVAFKD